MAPRGRSRAVGIDLGTAYTCVGAWRSKDRTVEIIRNDKGNLITPSVVAFTNTDCLVGQAALNQMASNPSNTVFDTKRLIGRQYRDATVQTNMPFWPFTVLPGIDNKPAIEVIFKKERKSYAAEDISAMVLAKMRVIAEKSMDSPVTKAVITVPACFNNSQRRATREAAKAAGFEVLQIVNEPTAAAVAYAVHTKAVPSKEGEDILVFDLGGGTVDVSVIQIKGKKITVRAVSGDTHLGGEDFTDRIVAHVVRDFKRRRDIDINEDKRALRRLRCECERAKCELSFTAETIIDVPSLHDGEDLQMLLKKSKFEQLNTDLFEKCIRVVTDCIADAGMENSEIKKVVLVGGSTRVPKIQDMLKDLFEGNILCKTVHPDEAVAYGAAVLAAMNNKEYNGVDISVRDVTALTVGMGTQARLMSVIIPRNTPIPTKAIFNFAAIKEDQKALMVNVYESQGVNKFSTAGCFEAGRSEVSSVSVYVKMEIDCNGLLSISAEDRSAGLKIELLFCEHVGSAVSRLKSEVEMIKEVDKASMETAEIRNELDLLIYELKKKAYGYGHDLDVVTDIVGDLDAITKWLSENPQGTKTELQNKIMKVKILGEWLARLLLQKP